MLWDFDVAFYKVLAANDTGQSSGHQGGVVIPRAIARYFPYLHAAPGSPTADHSIAAELWLENAFLGKVRTRYQIQTWGRTRRPEHRLTGNLGPLRDKAQAGDILIFERQRGTLDHYRLTLIRSGSDSHATVLERVSKSGRSTGTIGFLDGDRTQPAESSGEKPVEGEDLAQQASLLQSDATKDSFDPQGGRDRPSSISKRTLRYEAFSIEVRKMYGFACAVTGLALQTPDGLSEVEAAHIIPASAGGPDDLRNGIAMSRAIHWAFDLGLFTVSKDYKFVASSFALSEPDNRYLATLDGNTLRPPLRPIYPASKALEWHTSHCFLGR